MIERHKRTPEWLNSLGRCSRYLTIRTVVVAITVLAGIYAAIWLTNLGGFGDEQRRDEITSKVVLGFNLRGQSSLTSDGLAQLNAAIAAAIAAADLDRPFFVRSLGYLRDAFTLTLGRARAVRSRAGSDSVLEILMEKLPWTLLLFGVANVITFFAGLYIALVLSRRYGGPLDRTVTLLIPLFAAPPWFHGVFLIVIFALVAKLLPFGGILDAPVPDTAIAYTFSILKHMVLPVAAFVFGTLPHAVYANRALFMINSSADFVEVAKAKGISPGRLRLRYILRPVLPAIITNFALVSIVSWQAAILTEHVFNWPGIGQILIDAVRSHETSVVIGAVTLFAFMLGFTVLFLDIIYVLVDPRVKLQSGGNR